MNDATQILSDAVAKLYALCDEILPTNHSLALRVETLGIQVEEILNSVSGGTASA